MSKLGLIANLEEDSTSPKKKFQIFEAQMGFEVSRVLIPVDEADNFEKAALKSKPKTVTSFMSLAKKFGGQAE